VRKLTRLPPRRIYAATGVSIEKAAEDGLHPQSVRRPPRSLMEFETV